MELSQQGVGGGDKMKSAIMTYSVISTFPFQMKTMYQKDYLSLSL
jgi:hypothetical protein